MTDPKEPTYERLFARYLKEVLAGIVAATERIPGNRREEWFEQFLEGHMFICSTCGNEFMVASTEETALVRCGECRR
jgi:hypothetical protein